ncbi:MAG: PadR family transcriptional regulator [Candidatus Aminicenantes bacterium]|nr:PadR family transcriptional regulator [Candidatus Aminicenantes bacterium]
MNFLSRSEEMVLVTVWKLKEKAYSVIIREQLRKVTGKKWSFGSVYNPLSRLEKRGFLDSYTTDPVSERGGRSKRVYRVTPKGQEALTQLWSIQASLWEAAPELKR